MDSNNPSVNAVIRRLPKSEILSVADITSAVGTKSSTAIYDAIETGDLAAIRCGNVYRIARTEVERWIRSLSTR